MNKNKMNKLPIDPIEGPMTIKKPTTRDERLQKKFSPDEKEVGRGSESLMFHSEAPLSEDKKLNSIDKPEMSELGQDLKTLLGKADALIDEIDLAQAQGGGAEEMIRKEVELLKLKEEHLGLKSKLESVDPVTNKRLQEENQAINSKLNLIQDHIAKSNYKSAA